MINYHERIVRNSGILAGKTVIKWTRIPVELVLQYLASDPDIKNVFAAFPHLTIDDIKACFSYAQELVEEEQAFPLREEPIQKQAYL